MSVFMVSIGAFVMLMLAVGVILLVAVLVSLHLLAGMRVGRRRGLRLLVKDVAAARGDAASQDW